MYFLTILFIIVLIKLYLNVNFKEQFLLFTPKKIPTKEDSNEPSEGTTEYDEKKDFYIKQIFDKFEDLENLKNDIQSIKDETKTIQNKNEELRNINARNKLKLNA